MREKLSFWQLGLTYAGCFLGAGYVSGQELWQFFGAFGERWRAGLMLAMILIFGFGCIILWIIWQIKPVNTADIVIRKECRPLKMLIDGAIMLFLYAVIIIMSAGVGAVLEQLFAWPARVVSAGFCFLCALASLGGLRGMVRYFSAVVPFLAAMAIIVSLRICRSGIIAEQTIISADNGLLGAWYTGALVFVAHNIFGALGILAPLGPLIKDRRSLLGAAAFGVAVLGSIALAVLKALNVMPIAASKQLPMLYLAAYCGDGVGLIYGILLIMAMSASALAALVALEESLAAKWLGGRRSLALILALAAAAGAQGGFSRLISIIYPLCGYCGIVVLIGVSEHFVYLYRQKKDCSS